MHSNALFSVFLPTHTHNLHYNYERPTIQRICLWTWPPDTNDAPNAQAHAPSLFWCHEFRRLKRQKAHQATELQKQCRCLVCVLPHLRDRHGSCSVLDHYPRSQCPCPPLLSPSWKILFLCLSFSPLPPILPLSKNITLINVGLRQKSYLYDLTLPNKWILCSSLLLTIFLKQMRLTEPV